ncbi:MAG: FtsX-like permease family protein [Bacteroidales bacterium]|nr:FtsX-like permease family protein [Bacteroidales bacterium]
MNFLKLAWRNIWRNKRRTLIAAGSLYFAIVFALFMRSMQFGSYDIMIENSVKMYSGFIQIQDSTYWVDKSMDDLMEFNADLEAKINAQNGVIAVNPRLESFALSSFGLKTKGVFIQGINPDKDDQMTRMSKRLIDGSYVENGENGIVVSSRLAEYLGVKIGDSLVFLSQGYQGVTAADQFPIRGIIKLAIPELDNRLVVMPLDIAQNYYSAPGMVSSLSLDIEGGQHAVDGIAEGLRSALQNTSLEVLKWTDLNAVLKQQIDSDNASGLLMLMILYMVIFFGILGTIIMMTTERMKEFGVMVAVGMSRKTLLFITLTENLFIGLLGTISGLVSSLPFIFYYYNHPIRITGELAAATEQYGMEPLLGFSLEPMIFINQFLIVLMLMGLTLVYPAYKISTLKVIHALRA